MAKFKKGQSGNPGGRPKENLQLKELAREKTIEALETLSEVMGDKAAPPAARVSAACAILDRGYGKPVQSTELSGPDGGPIETTNEDISDAARRIIYMIQKGINTKGDN